MKIKNIKDITPSYLKDLKTQTQRPIAIFDADGTLWRGDIGDDFFAFQRENKSMKAAPTQGAALLDAYCKEHDRDAEYAYGLMAQWNAGNSEKDLQKWVSFCWDQFDSSRIIPEQKKLIKDLHDLQYEVWVVSASPWWVVVEGVKRHFGVEASKVLATKTKTVDGIITDEFEYELPYKKGKVKAIEKFIKSTPTIVSGNSMGDYDMMCLADGLALVINTAKPNSMYYESEQEVAAIARKSPGKASWVVLES